MTKSLKVRRIHVYLSSVLLMFGFIVAYSVQVTDRTNHEVGDRADSEWKQKVRLNEKIIHEKETNEMLQERLQKLRTEVNAKEKEMSERQAISQQVVHELEMLRMQAGLTPVFGQGVTVTLEDSKTARDFQNVADGIVHDQNLRDVVNELFAAGAEGIAINDQRLVSGSSVRCVGPTIIVNDIKLAPPFVIRAIGEKETLVAALKMPGGIIDGLKQRTISVTISESNRIELPAYVGENNDKKTISLREESNGGEGQNEK